MPSTETETKPDQLDALAPYNELRSHIEGLKSENAELTYNYADPKENKLARSHVFKLRKLKAEIDRKRKALKADALEYGRKVDGIAKDLTGEVESMIDVHQKPLDEIEQREAARIAEIRTWLGKLAMPTEIIVDSASCKAIATRIADIDTENGWDEFKAEAQETKRQTLAALKARYDVLKQQEREEQDRIEAAEREERDRIEAEKRAAEERQRAEEEERSRREAQIREETEQRVREEAEEKAEAARKAEADKAMAEARRKEAEANAAIEAEREKAAQAQREAEQAKREKAEAEAKAEAEKAAAEKAEQQRKEAEAKRQADQQHRQNILDEVANAIAGLCEDTPPQDFAARIAEAIANGDVPHTSIQF